MYYVLLHRKLVNFFNKFSTAAVLRKKHFQISKYPRGKPFLVKDQISYIKSLLFQYYLKTVSIKL